MIDNNCRLTPLQNLILYSLWFSPFLIPIIFGFSILHHNLSYKPVEYTIAVHYIDKTIDTINLVSYTPPELDHNGNLSYSFDKHPRGPIEKIKCSNLKRFEIIDATEINNVE